MGPHDLLCKWCSTFVGKGKKFCSIFCESRYTRSKRRKLAFKRPVYSSGPRDEKEYVSPRTNRTAPAMKQSFLEDVITAIENNKPSPERDKNRRHHYTSRISDDEVGYCKFCCRKLYIPGTVFCDRGCENRKRQLSWKSAHIELPKVRRNRYVWDNQAKRQDEFSNFTDYKPSWEMVGQ
ncbi:hypothetical protein ACF0H5_020240 [Mactra antiquata]